MKSATAIIRCDAEFGKFLHSLGAVIKSPEPLPIAVNGLSGGAELAFQAEEFKIDLIGLP